MNDASKSNGSASVAQQPIERNNYAKLTEAEFLVHEAELAKTALSSTLADLKGSLAQAGDIKLWTHHYPWLGVGLAAATGFTLAAIAKRGVANETLVKDADTERQRLLFETARAPYTGHDQRNPKFADSLLGSLFSLARTALEASLVSAIREQGAHAAAETACPSTASTPTHTTP